MKKSNEKTNEMMKNALCEGFFSDNNDASDDLMVANILDYIEALSVAVSELAQLEPTKKETIWELSLLQNELINSLSAYRRMKLLSEHDENGSEE